MPIDLCVLGDLLFKPECRQSLKNFGRFNVFDRSTQKPPAILRFAIEKPKDPRHFNKFAAKKISPDDSWHFMNLGLGSRLRPSFVICAFVICHCAQAPRRELPTPQPSPKLRAG
jgi:hypothetical protein